MNLGRTQSPLDPRTLRHATYRVAAALPQFPPTEDYTVPSWPMYLNDTIGDCAVAGPAHMIQAWTARGAGEVTLADADVLAAYRAISGYDPADPSTDTGCNLLDVLKYWQSTGIGGHKIGPYVAIDPTNQSEVCEAHHLYVGVLLGLDMPAAWQQATTWDVGPSQTGDWGVGTWGGHCVCGERYALVVGVTAAGLYVVTWGGLMLLTWAALAIYCSEAYGILSQDFLSNNKAPCGLDYAALAADLVAVQQMPRAAGVAYKAVPAPGHSMMLDTTLRITLSQARAIAADPHNVVAIGRYLGGLTPQELADITSAGLGVVGLNYSRANNWHPSAAAGTADAARDVGQAKALGFPAGATIMFDLEGVASDPTAHLEAWAKGITAAGFVAGVYCDGQDKLSGAALGALKGITRYWNGASVGQAEPLYRGWCAQQERPGDDSCCGVEVDFSALFQDARNNVLSMVVAG